MKEEIPLLLAGKAVGSRISVIKIFGHKGASIPIPGAFLDIEVKCAGSAPRHMGHIAEGGHITLDSDGFGIGLEFDSPSGCVGVKVLNTLIGLLSHGLRKPPEHGLLFIIVQSINLKGVFPHISKYHKSIFLSWAGDSMPDGNDIMDGDLWNIKE